MENDHVEGHETDVVHKNIRSHFPLKGTKRGTDIFGIDIRAAPVVEKLMASFN
jgi:hypothetical protein